MQHLRPGVGFPGSQAFPRTAFTPEALVRKFALFTLVWSIQHRFLLNLKYTAFFSSLYGQDGEIDEYVTHSFLCHFTDPAARGTKCLQVSSCERG